MKAKFLKIARFAQFSFSVAGIAMLITGCAHSPKMSEADVVRIANRVAEADGYALTNYMVPEAHYEFVKRDRRWIVFYNAKSPNAPLGSDFLIWVGDKTGATQVGQGE